MTEEDITEFTERKFDRHFISVLTVVRHCALLKQVRSGKNY